MAQRTTLPSSPTRIFLVRHGTTMLNRSSRYRGRRDVPLDRGGWDDAWSAAAQLADAGLDAVYSSPLRRARDTARIVADAAGVPDVVDLPGLVNLDYGLWEGLTAEESAALDPAAFSDYQCFAQGATCPDGESLELAAARTELSLRAVAALHPGGTVAAVTHAAVVRLALVAAGAADRSTWRLSLPNGSVTVLDATPTLLDASAGRVGAVA